MTSSSEIQPEPPNETTTEKTDLSSSESNPTFGWTSYAERINGRFAMIGLVVLLLLEWISRQDFFTWLGLR